VDPCKAGPRLLGRDRGHGRALRNDVQGAKARPSPTNRRPGKDSGALQQRSDDRDVPLVAGDNRRNIGAVLAVLGATCGAGCGGDGALSRAEYVSRLNGACEDFRAKESQIGEPQTLDDLVTRGPRVLDAFEETILEEVRDLEAPDEIAHHAERLVDLAEEQRDALAALVAAATNGGVTEVRRLASKSQAVNQEANSITRELGAESCSRARR
jgi:hypothetical protein